tara:strand:+ start:393 stop:557 length:165 start_codon:yes stop_codon:yes gene_type:complete
MEDQVNSMTSFLKEEVKDIDNVRSKELTWNLSLGISSSSQPKFYGLDDGPVKNI